jgi:hypothetical protein
MAALMNVLSKESLTETTSELTCRLEMVADGLNSCRSSGGADELRRSFALLRMTRGLGEVRKIVDVLEDFGALFSEEFQ